MWCGSGASSGLAAAFTAGIDAALKLGADFIVNTDADNQYPGQQIGTLLAPLLSGQYDIVIGDRNIREIRHMSWQKKLLQRFGSWAVRQRLRHRSARTRRAGSARTRARPRCG